jgi:ABC-type multidrug transport system fused ATPase/permease subunit
LRQDLPNLESFERRVGDLQAEVAVFGAVPITEIRSVEFCNVEYEYIPGSPSLRGVSLRLEPGEVVGIVGPSGGGKTTLVQVLLRLRTPSKGTVLINGRPYEEFDTGCWADLMAMVPQEPRLMEASLADNISFLRKGISRAQIEQAADDAHVGADIRRLVQGFDTKLGSRGYGLSGGQKQRVAIARALVGRPKLLVLDEPTSALDVNSERLLQETIATLKGSVTMVIVAHRLSTLDVCDRLLVLRDGQVEAFGCRADLERESDFYQSIIAGLGAPVEEGAT